MATHHDKTSAKRRTRKSETLHGISEPKLVAAYAAAQGWLRRSYVTGLGIGYARKDGKPTREIALSVHVKKRLPDASLSERQRFPRTLMGVRVDVIEANMKAHLGPDEVDARRINAAVPLRPGVLIRSTSGDLGTVALLVRPRSSPGTLVLGSGHVMQSMSPFFQPGGGAANSLQLAVQRVERSRADAGIASYTNRPVQNRPIASSALITSVRPVRLDDVLTMSGAFSGNTVGIVDWIGLKTIHYEDGQAIKVPGFQLKPRTEDELLTQPGDSGALWFDEAGGAAVGINVGGSFDDGGEDIENVDIDSKEPWAFACHIVDVMDLLGVQI